MTAAQPSRTTLADLIPLIEKANLSHIQKRDQISAIRTLARLLDARVDEIDADPARLRKRLETIAPEALGLSRGRWNNIRSLVGKALALARPILPGRQTAPLLPEWEALFAPLSRNRAAGLRAMARYLSVRNVRPDEVTLADLRGLSRGDRQRPAPGQAGGDLGHDCLDLERLPARDYRLAGHRDPPRESPRSLCSAVVGLSTVPEGRCRCVSPSPVGRRPERRRPCASGKARDPEDQRKAVASCSLGARPQRRRPRVDSFTRRHRHP